MNRLSSKVTLGGGRFLAIGVSLVLTVAAAAPGYAEELQDFLSSLEEGYASVDSVHLRASAQIFLASDPRGAAAVGTGEFEYWGQGDRYRVACRTPPRLGLATDVSVAFDGDLFQLLLLEMNTLSIQGSDVGQLPVALPNPFFLPIEFLNPDDPDCNDCFLRIADLRDRRMWERRLAGARPEELASGDAQGWRSLRLPGGVVDGEPFEYRLTVQGRGASARLRRIERLVSGSQPILVMDLEAYRPVEKAGFDFPHEITLKVFTPGIENSVMELEYRVETIEVNRPLPPGVFTLKVDEDVKVWDSDAEKFLDSGDAPSP